MFFSATSYFGWEQLFTGCTGVLPVPCVSVRNEMQLALDRPWTVRL